MEEIIKRITPKDALNEFYNKHLSQFISANIDLEIWRSFNDQNATAYPEPVQTINPQGGMQQSSRKVSVTEAAERSEFMFRNQQRILRAIKELDKIDLEKTIDAEFKPRYAKIK